jgi:hypothetical protein
LTAGFFLNKYSTKAKIEKHVRTFYPLSGMSERKVTAISNQIAPIVKFVSREYHCGIDQALRIYPYLIKEEIRNELLLRYMTDTLKLLDYRD